MIPFGIPGAGELVESTGALAIDVPEGWRQGRTAYGGWSAVLALAAARWLGRAEGAEPLPPLRSAMVNFIGPVEGAVEARPRLLRRGRNAAWIGVEIVPAGGDALLLQATFVFMRPLDSAVIVANCPAPTDICEPEQGEQVMPADGEPAFRARFEARRTGRAHRLPAYSRWVRLAQREGADPEAEVLAVTDFLAPGALNHWGDRVPLSSMTWQVNFPAPSEGGVGGWWLLNARAVHAADGLDTEQVTVWNRAGQLAALAQQTVALFG